MSYSYRVTVTRSVKETVKGKDESRNKITLTEILPQGRMRDLLTEALGKKGFEKQADGTWKRTVGGVAEVFDPETMEVTATAEVAGDIEKEKSVQAIGDARRERDVQAQRTHAEREVGARLEKELAVTEAERKAKRQQLEQEARKRLEESEGRRMQDLNEATLDVYAEAIKEKAKTLGEVKEQKESRRDNGMGGQEYELIIRVEDDG